MINRDIIRAMADKEMDRKDFLKYSGLVLLSLVGLRALVSLLDNSNTHKASSSARQESKSGFGTGRYGA